MRVRLQQFRKSGVACADWLVRAWASRDGGDSGRRGGRRGAIGTEEGEEGGGEVDPELWGDLPPGAPQGWLRGNAGLPTPPSIEEHKWIIEPVGTE